MIEVDNKHPFEYQAPTPEQTQTIIELREAYKALYEKILTLPHSRERSVAITELEQSSMWVNKCIVFN